MSKTHSSKIDSGIITKEKLLAEANRTQINFIEKAKEKLRGLLKGATSKPSLGVEMKEEDGGSMFDRGLFSEAMATKVVDKGLSTDYDAFDKSEAGSPKKLNKSDTFTKELPPRQNQMTKFLAKNPIFIMPQN